MHVILQSFPRYFDDSIKINSFIEFREYFHLVREYCLTLTVDSKIVGCVYLTDKLQEFADFNIFIQRHTVSPSETYSVIRDAIRHYFKVTDLKMIGAVVRADNFPVIRIIKKGGGMITQFMEGHETVEGKPVDCIYASILREAEIL